MKAVIVGVFVFFISWCFSHKYLAVAFRQTFRSKLYVWQALLFDVAFGIMAYLLMR